VQIFGERTHYELKRLGEKYQDVVIDAGGRDSVELRAAMVTAQKLYTPLLPSQFDAWTLDKMAYLLKEVRAFNPNLTAKGVLNRVSTNPQVSEAIEAQEYLSEFDGIDLAKTVIRDRIAFRRAVRDGLSVVEMDRKDEKAIQEIEAFYREVFYE
jgi:chromosome partitioning protein